MKLHKKNFLLLTVFIAGIASAQNPSATDMLLRTWQFSEAGKNEWKKASVPGNIHRDLFENNMIADPLQKENYKLCQWIEKKNWEYQSFFEWNAKDFLQHTELVFDALDTDADVFLNDSIILKADNAFRSYIIPADKWLKPGQNCLRIFFHAPANCGLEKSRKVSIRYPADNDSLSPFVRKPALQYGWDFTPRMLSCGITKAVHLRTWGDFKICDLHIIQKQCNVSEAKMSAKISIESSASDSVLLSLEPYKVRKKILLQKGINQIEILFSVLHPRLWWPNGMGDPEMNEIWVEVKNKTNVEIRRTEFGIRTIEIINNSDSLGQSFYFKVNGIPLYAKGTNMVPPPLLMQDENYPALFDMMSECHFNMARVWGGGNYGDDTFYYLADHAGILIWQDFMFAGTMYPADSAFLNSVEKETEDQITRLRNHPSLALWCGNNEVDVAWKSWGWQKTFHYTKSDSTKLSDEYNLLFLNKLPKKIQMLDSGRFYFPSSPVSNWGNKKDFKIGDNHYWGVWHGEQPVENYNTHVPRFMSEFGFQSFPSISSIRKFSDTTSWNIYSKVMKAHQFSYKGNGLIEKYMDLYFKKPKNFESFVYVSQLLQAQAMKTAIEAQRRAKSFCMGSLFWQLNDYWPAASWSTIDYFGEVKGAYYTIKKAFEPVILSAVEEGDRLNIFCVSDEKKSRDGILSMLVQDMNGKIIQRFSKEIHVTGNISQKIFSVSLDKKKKDDAGVFPFIEKPESEFLSFFFISEKDTIASDIFYFVKDKFLLLEKPIVSYELKKEDDHYVMKLRTNVLARHVYISFQGKEGIIFSDNFFDLVPKGVKSISIFSELNSTELKKSCVIRSLWDSYLEK